LFKNHFFNFSIIGIFAVPGKAEAGSAGEQPARNTLVHENEPAHVPVSLSHSFALCLKKPMLLNN
jgi:hypothetical protein